MMDQKRDPVRKPSKDGLARWAGLSGAFFISPHSSGITSPIPMVITGVAIALAIVGFFLFFFYLPTRSRKLSRSGRAKKRGRQVRYARRQEDWMDQIAQTELNARDRRNLAKHLSSVHPELRQKAAKVLRQKGRPEDIREAQRQLAERGQPDLVADAIISAQWREMEPALLPLMNGKERIAVAAISAMAEVGGGASLSALLAQKERPDLAGARERAIARLQKRLEGRNAGQVALADGAGSGGTLGIPEV